MNFFFAPVPGQAANQTKPEHGWFGVQCAASPGPTRPTATSDQPSLPAIGTTSPPPDQSVIDVDGQWTGLAEFYLWRAACSACLLAAHCAI